MKEEFLLANLAERFGFFVLMSFSTSTRIVLILAVKMTTP